MKNFLSPIALYDDIVHLSKWKVQHVVFHIKIQGLSTKNCQMLPIRNLLCAFYLLNCR